MKLWMMMINVHCTQPYMLNVHSFGMRIIRPHPLTILIIRITPHLSTNNGYIPVQSHHWHCFLPDLLTLQKKEGGNEYIERCQVIKIPKYGNGLRRL